jgi:hypothetical protein
VGIEEISARPSVRVHAVGLIFVLATAQKRTVGVWVKNSTEFND